MNPQLYRFLEPYEITQEGDEYVCLIGGGDLAISRVPVITQVHRSIALRPVPTPGWRRWEEVKPTEADADEEGNVRFAWNASDGHPFCQILNWGAVHFSGRNNIHWHPLPKMPELKKPEPVDEERARFEAWANGGGRDIDRKNDGGYASVTTHHAWLAWQAATIRKS
jgi:hypothetical protein